MSKQILSWNVNGVRSVAAKGFLEWFTNAKPDVLCLQETKASHEQLGTDLTAPWGYQTYWFSAKKPGYSGVAVFSKETPLDIVDGLHAKEFDDEGRVLSVYYKDFVVVNAYFPNSQREHARLGYKLEFCEAISEHVHKLVRKKHSVILCGDYNIAHQEIDLRNPKSNQNNAGFLPQEREWMTKFLSSGFIDTFRAKVGEVPHHYSWWSYRPGVRERNIGWRIDYHCVNAAMKERVSDAFIWPHIGGSDHCPVGIEID